MSYYSRLNSNLLERIFVALRQSDSAKTVQAERSELIAVVMILTIVVSMTKAFALTNACEIMLFVYVVANNHLRNLCKNTFRDSRVLLVMLFLTWAGISCFWSSADVPERFADLWSWRKLLLVPICFSVMTTTSRLRALEVSLVTVCSLFLFVSVIDAFGIYELTREPSQLLENHATQGVLFSASTAICVLLGSSTSSIPLKYFVFGLAILFCVNVFWIGTGRSGYVFFVATGVYLIYRLTPVKLRTGYLALAIVLVTGIFLESSAASQRLMQAYNEIRQVSTIDAEYSSMGVRIVMWNVTLSMIADKPFLGTGAGAYKYDYSTKVDGVEGWKGSVSDDPHQQYLHIAAEYGISGLLIFLLCLVSWLMSRAGSGEEGYYLPVAKGFLLATFLNGFANGHFSSFVEGRFIWIFLACFCAGSRDVLGGLVARAASKALTRSWK